MTASAPPRRASGPMPGRRRATGEDGAFSAAWEGKAPQAPRRADRAAAAMRLDATGSGESVDRAAAPGGEGRVAGHDHWAPGARIFRRAFCAVARLVRAASTAAWPGRVAPARSRGTPADSDTRPGMSAPAGCAGNGTRVRAPEGEGCAAGNAAAAVRLETAPHAPFGDGLTRAARRPNAPADWVASSASAFKSPRSTSSRSIISAGSPRP